MELGLVWSVAVMFMGASVVTCGTWEWNWGCFFYDEKLQINYTKCGDVPRLGFGSFGAISELGAYGEFEYFDDGGWGELARFSGAGGVSIAGAFAWGIF